MFSRFHLASDAASFQTASNPAIGASSTCSSGRRVVPKARRMPIWSSSAQDLDIPRTDLFEGACHLQQCSSQHGTPMRGSRCCTVLVRRFGMKLRKRWPGGRRGQRGGSEGRLGVRLLSCNVGRLACVFWHPPLGPKTNHLKATIPVFGQCFFCSNWE